MAAKYMGLDLQDQTKYTVIDRKITNTQNLVVNNYTFQILTDFKYLGTNINNKNNMHNKIKLRILAANKDTSPWKNYLSSKYYV